MADALIQRMHTSVSATPLEAAFDLQVEPLRAASVSGSIACSAPPLIVRGLARCIASHPDVARYLRARPQLLERILKSPEDALEVRERELELLALDSGCDLESVLDELRYLRRDETLFAATFDLGGLYPQERIASFLSTLAQACVRWAVRVAEASSPRPPGWVIIGMGKVGSGELTYHSDLDLVFLYPDSDGRSAEVARLAQRLIGYLSTVTRAGVAYAVDARLRPSGHQGALVSSFESYLRYQRERASRWEHLALTRARELAGLEDAGRELLERIREQLRTDRSFDWKSVDAMRRRIETERKASAGAGFKTGPGGLIDVEFLASGAELEAGPTAGIPTTAHLLRRHATGPGVEALLADYALLRLLEARARFALGRSIESFDFARPDAARIAELVRPRADPAVLEQDVRRARKRIRKVYEDVIGAGSISALGPPPRDPRTASIDSRHPLRPPRVRLGRPR